MKRNGKKLENIFLRNENVIDEMVKLQGKGSSKDKFISLEDAKNLILDVISVEECEEQVNIENIDYVLWTLLQTDDGKD